MRVFVLTAFEKNYTHGLKIVPYTEAYAKRHGYSYVCRRTCYLPTRTPQWNKVLFVKRYLRHCDWLFWIDPDALIIAPEVTVESVVAYHAKGRDLIVSLDSMGICMGVCFFRNCEWTFNFLDMMLGMEHYRNCHYSDTCAANEIYHTSPEDADHMALVHQHHFNAYLGQPHCEMVLHFAGDGAKPHIDAHVAALQKKARETQKVRARETMLAPHPYAFARTPRRRPKA